jgi:hypothetical protein
MHHSFPGHFFVHQPGNGEYLQYGEKPFAAQQGGIPELYPQQLTRMHSVNSLVSTDEQHSDSLSDTSVRDELQNVISANQQSFHSSQNDIPSGRRSPILGEHAPSRGLPYGPSPPTENIGASPPTIMPVYNMPGGFPHPQPHQMTPEQLSAWMQASSAAAQQMHPRNSFYAEGAKDMSGSTYYSRESLAYSKDSDVQQHSMSQAPAYPRKAQGGILSHGEPSLDRGGIEDSTFADLKKASSDGVGGDHTSPPSGERGFKVYWQRWIMLFVSYVSC